MCVLFSYCDVMTIVCCRLYVVFVVLINEVKHQGFLKQIDEFVKI